MGSLVKDVVVKKGKTESGQFHHAPSQRRRGEGVGEGGGQDTLEVLRLLMFFAWSLGV